VSRALRHWHWHWSALTVCDRGCVLNAVSGHLVTFVQLLAPYRVAWPLLLALHYLGSKCKKRLGWIGLFEESRTECSISRWVPSSSSRIVLMTAPAATPATVASLFRPFFLRRRPMRPTACTARSDKRAFVSISVQRRPVLRSAASDVMGWPVAWRLVLVRVC
jgi:hypothetical protein